MVRATIIVSALFALASTVYAKGTLVNIDGGHHIGVNNLNLQGLGHEAVDARGTVVRDVVQNVDVLDHDHDDHFDVIDAPPRRISRPVVVHEHDHDCHDDHHGLLGHLLKREEDVAAKDAEAAGAVEMAAVGRRPSNMRRKNLRKHMKKNARARRH